MLGPTSSNLPKGEIPCLTKTPNENANGNKPTANAEPSAADCSGRANSNRRSPVDLHLKKRKAMQAGGSRLLPLLLRSWGQLFCRTHNQDNNEIVDTFFWQNSCVISRCYFQFHFKKPGSGQNVILSRFS
jgi:hypothetical protein